MKKLAAILLIVIAALAAFAQTPNLSDVKPTPAERSILQAKWLIEKNPKDFEAYNALALALSRRARETSDVNYYAQAEEALQKSFAISTDNFDGERTHVWLLLGKHEFAAALEGDRKAEYEAALKLQRCGGGRTNDARPASRESARTDARSIFA